jgi:hypothetical protein
MDLLAKSRTNVTVLVSLFNKTVKIPKQSLLHPRGVTDWRSEYYVPCTLIGAHNIKPSGDSTKKLIH